MSTSVRAVLAGVAATLALAAGAALPAASAHAIDAPQPTWKWKGAPDPQG
jgi:hypothetical protein